MNSGVKTLLTIDWDFFVPEAPNWGLHNFEEDFFIYDVWDIRAVYKDMHNKMKTSGLERVFWEEVKNKLDLHKVNYVDVSDSHKLAYDIAVENGVTKIISLDAHCDMREEKNCINCANWLMALLNKGMEATLILSEYTNERIDSIDCNGHKVDILDLKKFINSSGIIDVDYIHICRSGAWTPPWTDGVFNEFTRELGKPIMLDDDLRPRSFSFEEAKNKYGKSLKGLRLEGIKTIYEWCGECDTEVELDAVFEEQECPNCGKRIVPCNICMMIGLGCDTGCHLK